MSQISAGSIAVELTLDSSPLTEDLPRVSRQLGRWAKETSRVDLSPRILRDLDREVDRAGRAQSRFRRGLESTARSALGLRGAAGVAAGAFGGLIAPLGVVTATIGTVSAGVRAYARENREFALELEGLTRRSERAWAKYGQSVSAVYLDIRRGLQDLVDGALDGLGRVSDALADGIDTASGRPGDRAAGERAQARADAERRIFERDRAVERLRLEEAALGEGPEGIAAAGELRARRERERILAAAEKAGIDAVGRADLLDAAREREERRTQRELRAELARDEASALESQAAELERRRAEILALTRIFGRVTPEEAEGAELAGQEARGLRERARIILDEGLSDDERARELAEAQRARSLEIEAGRAERRRAQRRAEEAAGLELETRRLDLARRAADLGGPAISREAERRVGLARIDLDLARQRREIEAQVTDEAQRRSLLAQAQALADEERALLALRPVGEGRGRGLPPGVEAIESLPAGLDALTLRQIAGGPGQGVTQASQRTADAAVAIRELLERLLSGGGVPAVAQ